MAYLSPAGASRSIEPPDIGRDVNAAADYLRNVWGSFVGLGPSIIALQHRAALLAQRARAAGQGQLAELAKDVIAQLGRLNVLHGRVIDRLNDVRSFVGLGSFGRLGAIPAAQVTVITGLALLVLWFFRSYEAQERKLDMIEAGTLTPAEAARLDPGPAPTRVLGGVADVAKWLLAGAVLYLIVQAATGRRLASLFRVNPDLVVLDNPDGEGGRFGDHVMAVWYQHTEDGEHYVHEFEPGVEMIAETDGSVTLRHPRKRIWGDF